MRINKRVAAGSSLSRRAADQAIAQGRVQINGSTAAAGQETADTDQVTLDGQVIGLPVSLQTILLNKPAGYVVSRNGQGSKTVYDLLPPQLQNLKPVGRLDKDSSGLLLLTNDGQLAQELTHPRHKKVKAYEIELDKPLAPLHRRIISAHGVQLKDGMSRLELELLRNGDDKAWRVRMHEGRNRQIRRTFAALGYRVIKLHRTHFGTFSLGRLQPSAYEGVPMPSSSAASPKR